MHKHSKVASECTNPYITPQLFKFSPLHVHQVTTVSSPSQVEFRPFECAESSGGLRFVMALLVVALSAEEVQIFRILPPCFSPPHIYS